ncbi:MAG: DUF2279 domain-containing protein [Campylobacterales bacterium]|nr:DUF2279 domain-containing protein [Campylobacterales bacterium]
MRYFNCTPLLLILFCNALPADDTNQTLSWSDQFSKSHKVIASNAAITAGILTWGFTQWGYGTEDFHTDREGWFEADTSNGGSDKLGHFYTNYLITRTMAPLYESWGYSKNQAALYGALSAELSSVMIEVGDGYSEHGFSQEDLWVDTLGVATGALWHIYPDLASKVDFRIEYDPWKKTDNVTDFTTDYERMKHLMAIKGEGFELFEDTPLAYLELHVGYYSRNFNHDSLPIEGRERNLYVGVGINLSRILRPSLGRYATLFNYLQIPKTYLERTNTY